MIPIEKIIEQSLQVEIIKRTMKSTSELMNFLLYHSQLLEIFSIMKSLYFMELGVQYQDWTTLLFNMVS